MFAKKRNCGNCAPVYTRARFSHIIDVITPKQIRVFRCCTCAQFFLDFLCFPASFWYLWDGFFLLIWPLWRPVCPVCGLVGALAGSMSRKKHPRCEQLRPWLLKLLQHGQKNTKRTRILNPQAGLCDTTAHPPNYSIPSMPSPPFSLSWPAACAHIL
jgi:hypothetical protein